jgi:glycosyltransferase involved in cell wall biosynthesis
MHFAKWANPGVPVIACTHNYQTKRFVHADVVIALTPDLKRHVESQGVPPEKIHLVPNCVRIPERRAPRNRSSRPRISAMGRFVPKKGFDVLLNALADLKQRGVEFSCFLGGDGPESEALRALTNRLGLANDVTFAGWVTDKAQFFANTDIFCVPSRHEPFGIIVLEAMAAGLPVITTDSEGPTAIVRHGHDGLITPKDDPIALSAALERLIKDGNLSESLARNGHTNAERNYALPVVAAKIDEVVRKAVESYVRRSWLR